MTESYPPLQRGRPWLHGGYLNALLVGILAGQIAFWLWFALPRFTGHPFGTDDFAAFWTAASMLRGGQAFQIYDLPTVAAVQAALGLPQTVPFLYPPFFLILVLPFTYLQPGPAYVLWGLMNMGLIALSAAFLARTFVPQGERLTFALLVCASLPAGRAHYLGQTSFILLLGLSVAVAGFLASRSGRAGLASTVLLIKPQLLPIWLLTLLWYRRLGALAYFAAGSALLFLVSLALVGTEGMAGYLRALLMAGTSDRVGFQAIGSHTLAGLAFGLGGEAESRAIYLALAGIAAALYCWWIFRLRRQTPSSLRVAAAMAVVTALLVSSHSLMYDLVLWSIPLAIYWRELSRGWGRALLFAGYATPWFTSFFGMMGAGFVWPTVAVGIVAFGLLGREAMREAS